VRGKKDIIETTVFLWGRREKKILRGAEGRKPGGL